MSNTTMRRRCEIAVTLRARKIGATGIGSFRFSWRARALSNRREIEAGTVAHCAAVAHACGAARHPGACCALVAVGRALGLGYIAVGEAGVASRKECNEPAVERAHRAIRLPVSPPRRTACAGNARPGEEADRHGRRRAAGFAAGAARRRGGCQRASVEPVSARRRHARVSARGPRPTARSTRRSRAHSRRWASRPPWPREDAEPQGSTRGHASRRRRGAR